jgi:hypothetical protein
MPIGQWIRGPHAGMFRDEVLSASSPVSQHLDTSELERLFDRQRQGAGDHAYALWMAWVLARWLRGVSAHAPALTPADSAVVPSR